MEFGSGLIPAANLFTGAYTAITGRTFFTNHEVSGFDRYGAIVPGVRQGRAVYNAANGRFRNIPNPFGRLGSPLTREQNQRIADELKSREFRVTRGGGTKPEEFIPGPGGVRRGSAYPDITAIKNERTLRVNTIDTLKDGVSPTAREARNAARIRSLRPNDHLLLIPKQK